MTEKAVWHRVEESAKSIGMPTTRPRSELGQGLAIAALL
jgi:hypothetical protein